MALVQLNLDPDARQLRTFGAVGLVVFGALAGWAWHSGRLFGFSLGDSTSVAINILGALAGYCGVFAVVFPKALKPVFIGMSLITLPIGLVVSHLVMIALYYLVMTPLGLALRMTGRDPLARTLDRTQGSYWSRRAAAPPVDRYFRQF